MIKSLQDSIFTGAHGRAAHSIFTILKGLEYLASGMVGRMLSQKAGTFCCRGPVSNPPLFCPGGERVCPRDGWPSTLFHTTGATACSVSLHGLWPAAWIGEVGLRRPNLTDWYTNWQNSQMFASFSRKPKQIQLHTKI